jgi:hypothetical protein
VAKEVERAQHLQLVVQAAEEDKMVEIILDQGQLEIRRQLHHHKVTTAEQDGRRAALVLVGVAAVQEVLVAMHRQVRPEMAVWVQHHP